MQRLLGTFFVTWVVLFAQEGHAFQCKELFHRHLSISKIDIEKWLAVEQCGGTCYFESAVAHLEVGIKQKLGKEISVARPQLFSMVALHRFHMAMTRLAAPSAKINEPYLLDGGTLADIRSLFYKYKVPIIKGVQKSASLLKAEKALMEEVYLEFQILLEAVQTKRKGIEQAIEEANLLANRFMNATSTLYSKHKMPLIQEYDAHSISYRMIKKSDITLALIERELSQSKTIVLAFRVGIFDVVDPSGLYLEGRFSLSAPRRSAGPHSVLLVSLLRHPVTGEVYFQMRNSWGQNSGDQGYFYMDQKTLFSRLQFIEIIDFE